MDVRQKREALARKNQERRQREDDCSRLTTEIPALRTLRVDVVENAGGTTVKYAKLIVVPRAPALFVFDCGDPRCVVGGHDVTAALMRALKMVLVRFEGESTCEGMTGSAPCTRTIRYVGQASYRA